MSERFGLPATAPAPQPIGRAPHDTERPPAAQADDDETVDHPKHYTSHPARCECGRGIECIQVVEHFGFNLGNAVKYVWRAGLKSENAIEDLKKSVWYINREIARLTGPK